MQPPRTNRCNIPDFNASDDAKPPRADLLSDRIPQQLAADARRIPPIQDAWSATRKVDVNEYDHFRLQGMRCQYYRRFDPRRCSSQQACRVQQVVLQPHQENAPTVDNTTLAFLAAPRRAARCVFVLCADDVSLHSRSELEGNFVFRTCPAIDHCPWLIPGDGIQMCLLAI